MRQRSVPNANHDVPDASKTCSQTVVVIEPSTSQAASQPRPQGLSQSDDEEDYLSCMSRESNCSHISLKHARTCRHLATRSVMTNPMECAHWDEFEDRLLRVLNYKYYERDLKTFCRNTKYKDGKTQSDPFMVEGVMQTIIYDDYEDNRSRPVDIIRSTLPTRQQPEVVYIRGRLCRNFVKFWWNVVTLRFCRNRRQRNSFTPRFAGPMSQN